MNVFGIKMKFIQKLNPFYPFSFIHTNKGNKISEISSN